MRYQIECPCGQTIVAADAVFVDLVNEHLAAAHDGRTYTEEQIMFLASPAPDGARGSDPP
ncbi:hypothetical protein BHE97_07860 [Aeromicrobium sp. PE09-221]|uniref:hypothetical protein n=1 Tax=Actinomycetes TaxID=1760 RepID=UPI000B3E6F98|nr:MULTISPECIES: hypothetical protein [Actinomycetes]MCT2139257.1 hypothetical protein [Dietzia cinnamea]OUZ10259.1 hypothetical protein BHE97_07860 [Aeromicrobium sp. PE09-221]